MSRDPACMHHDLQSEVDRAEESARRLRTPEAEHAHGEALATRRVMTTPIVGARGCSCVWCFAVRTTAQWYVRGCGCTTCTEAVKLERALELMHVLEPCPLCIREGRAHASILMPVTGPMLCAEHAEFVTSLQGALLDALGPLWPKR